MTDSYKSDVERIQRLLVQTKADLAKRDQKKSAGQPVGMIEGEIRGSLTNLGKLIKILKQHQQKERELDLFNIVIENQSKNQSANNLVQQETQRRRNQYTDFLNQKNELKSRFNESVQQAKDNLFKEAQNAKKGGKFSDNVDVQNMSNKDLYQKQKDLEAQQDQQLDRVNEKLTTIKYTGQAMNDNIKQQNKMLDQVNLDVDQTTKEMMKTNSKLKKFIATSSNTCLIITIFLEIVTLILLCIYLP